MGKQVGKFYEINSKKRIEWLQESRVEKEAHSEEGEGVCRSWSGVSWTMAGGHARKAGRASNH